jgi:hypothetical protein
MDNGEGEGCKNDCEGVDEGINRVCQGEFLKNSDYPLPCLCM